MKRGIYLLVFAISLIFLSGSATRAEECTCREQTVCEAYGTADAVFVGEVVQGANADVAPGSIPPSERVPSYFVFKVKKNFAGTEVGKNVEILTGNGACAVQFRKSATYLVFANRSGTTLYTTVC